jgi:secreted PhoX family phosphatase
MANMRIPEGVSIDEPGRPAMTRREAVRNGALLVAGAGMGAQIMAATNADTAVARGVRRVAGATRDKPGYGPLVRVKGADFSLPKGFRVFKFGAAGTRMSDGLPTPKHHDGTTAFADGKHRIRLLRNQENASAGKSIGKHRAYDRAAQGGVTTSLFDTKKGKLLGSALVLNGTDNNCNGGPTPWGSWLTCEESTVGTNLGFEKPHGYVFEVPSGARGPVEPMPIKAMGRFLHEACALDTRTGIIYMTEDNGPDGFYRYIPDSPRHLHRGGKLQMLAVKGRSHYDTVTGQRVGEKLPCEWVTIDDPDPENAERHPDAVYRQGRDKGAARFMGLEGATWSKGSVYFTASEAGDIHRGQIWRYTPAKNIKHGTLTLLYESTDRKVLDEPDSVVVSPRGGVVLCEDGDGEDLDGGTNFLRCLTPKGTIETFARNETPLDLHRWEGEKKGEIGRSEWSGACYSPDGKWLFVHIQIPGVTYAITGPWQKGWL